MERIIEAVGLFTVASEEWFFGHPAFRPRYQTIIKELYTKYPNWFKNLGMNSLEEAIKAYWHQRSEIIKAANRQNSNTYEPSRLYKEKTRGHN